MGGVAIEHGGVAVLDLTRVRHDDDLGAEGGGTKSWVVLGVRAHETTLDILDGNVLAVETDVVTGDSLCKLLVVHFDGLDFSGKTNGAELNNHAGLQDTSLDTADGHCADTTDLVNILQRKTKRLVGRSLRFLNKIQSLEKDGALVPVHLVRALDHVVTNPTRDGNEVHLGGLVTDLLQVARNLLLDIVVTRLRVLGSVHLVKGDNHLGHTQSVGKKSVLLGLTISGPSTFESTGGRVDDKDSHIGLGGTSDHILDEITMSGGINHSELVLGGLELPESDIDGDTTLTLSLQVIKNPGVLERRLAHFGSFLLILLNGTLVNTSALVDQVTSGG